MSFDENPNFFESHHSADSIIKSNISFTEDSAILPVLAAVAAALSILDLVAEYLFHCSGLIPLPGGG